MCYIKSKDAKTMEKNLVHYLDEIDLELYEKEILYNKNLSNIEREWHPISHISMN